MYRTSSSHATLDPATRCAVILLAVCLLISAAPCLGFDANEACDLCDQDDLIEAPAAPLPMGLALFLERLNEPRISPPASLANQFPHPPIF